MAQAQAEDIKVLRIQKRCMQDFVFFCKFITINAFDLSKPPNEQEGKVDIPFELKKHQLEFIDFIEEKNKQPEKIVVKCRQIGMTEVCIAYCLWKLLYGYNEEILYTIAGIGKVRSCIRKIKTMMNTLRFDFPFLVPESVSIQQDGRCQNLQGNNYLTFCTMTDSARKIRNLYNCVYG